MAESTVLGMARVRDCVGNVRVDQSGCARGRQVGLASSGETADYIQLYLKDSVPKAALTAFTTEFLKCGSSISSFVRRCSLSDGVTELLIRIALVSPLGMSSCSLAVMLH